MDLSMITLIEMLCEKEYTKCPMPCLFYAVFKLGVVLPLSLLVNYIQYLTLPYKGDFERDYYNNRHRQFTSKLSLKLK